MRSSRRPFSPLSIFAEAYQPLKGRRSLWIPIIGYFLLGVAIESVTFALAAGIIPMPYPARGIADGFLRIFLMGAAFLFFCHLFTLNSDKRESALASIRKAIPPILLFSFLTFQWFPSFLSLLMTVRIELPDQLGWIVYVVYWPWILCSILFGPRLLPLMSMDANRESIKKSWRATKGLYWKILANGVLLEICLFGVFMVMGSIGQMFAVIASLSSEGSQGFPLAVIFTIAQGIVFALLRSIRLVLRSLFYRELVLRAVARTAYAR